MSLGLSIFLFWQGFSHNFSSDQGVSNKIASQSGQVFNNKFQVVRVIDGDTIEVSYQGQQIKVRLIGINTPETVDPRKKNECFGKQASNESKRLLEKKEIVLIKDTSETDKFGRLLRYMYLPLNDNDLLFVNDYLVREGFAKAQQFPPDTRFSHQFANAQIEAQSNKKGLWGSCF